MKLTDFLEEKGDEAELDSLRKTPDGKYEVKPSAYNRQKAKLEWVIAFLDDLYEIKQEGEEVSLVLKSNKINN